MTEQFQSQSHRYFSCSNSPWISCRSLQEIPSRGYQTLYNPEAGETWKTRFRRSRTHAFQTDQSLLKFNNHSPNGMKPSLSDAGIVTKHNPHRPLPTIQPNESRSEDTATSDEGNDGRNVDVDSLISKKVKSDTGNGSINHMEEDYSEKDCGETCFEKIQIKEKRSSSSLSSSLSSSCDMNGREDENLTSHEKYQRESLFDRLNNPHLDHEDNDIDDCDCVLELQQVNDEYSPDDDDDDDGYLNENLDEEAEDLFLELPMTKERKSSVTSTDYGSLSIMDQELERRPIECHHGAPKSETEIFSRFVSTLLAKNSKIDRQILLNAIEDCYGRFILNLPRQYLANHIQLCFAIQESYWWYDDFWFEQNSTTLPKLSMINFGFILCELCPLLRLYFNSEAYSSFMNQWRQYCRTIPLKGAILINNTLSKVLMVQGWKGGRWMFPRGKVDEEEDDVACAVREVKEEVGVDISRIVNPNVFIETSIDEQPIKLFLIPGILESTPFGPRKRKEIGRIRWIAVDKLPGWNFYARKRLRVAGHNKKLSTNRNDAKTLRFWNVFPFVEAFVGWLDLLVKGMKNRKATLKANPSDLMQNWMTPGDSTWPYAFQAPPSEYNEFLVKRYEVTITEEGYYDLTNAKLPKHPEDQHVTKFYKTQLGRSSSQKSKINKCFVEGTSSDDKKSVNKQLGMSSLTAPQPAAAKSSPLPPFVDETKSYRIPQTTSMKLLYRLQHPKTHIHSIYSDDRPPRRSLLESADGGLPEGNRQSRQRLYINGVYDGMSRSISTRYVKTLKQRQQIATTTTTKSIGIAGSTVGSMRILQRPKTPAETGRALLNVLKGTSNEINRPETGLMEICKDVKKPVSDNIVMNGVMSSRSILKDLQSLGLEVGQTTIQPEDEYDSSRNGRREIGTLENTENKLLRLIRGKSKGNLSLEESWAHDPAIVSSSSHLQPSEADNEEEEETLSYEKKHEAVVDGKGQWDSVGNKQIGSLQEMSQSNEIVLSHVCKSDMRSRHFQEQDRNLLEHQLHERILRDRFTFQRTPKTLHRPLRSRQSDSRENQMMIQTSSSSSIPSPILQMKEFHNRHQIEDETLRRYHSLNEKYLKFSGEREPSDVEEIVRLARLSYQTVNACRERLGRPKFSMSQFVNILGLTEED